MSYIRKYAVGTSDKKASITEHIVQTFGGNCDFGKKVTVTVCRNGDEIKDVFMVIDLPELDEYHRWVPYIGEAILRTVEFEIGGCRIDRHVSHYLHAYSALNLSDEEKKLYYKMIGHDPALYNKSYVSNGKVRWNTSGERELRIPLRFAFNKFEECKLPLIELDYNEVKINIEFEVTRNLIQCKSDCLHIHNHMPYDFSIQDAHLLVEYTMVNDYVKLPKREIPMDMVQFTGKETLPLTGLNHRIRLNFKGVAKEMMFMFKDPRLINMESNSFREDALDAPNLFGMNKLLNSAKLLVDGHDLMQTNSSNYFTQIQQLHHSNSDDSIYCHSFVKYPEQHKRQPSIDLTKVENLQLYLSLNTSDISYAFDCNSICRWNKCKCLLHKLVPDLKVKLFKMLTQSKYVELYIFMVTYQPLILEDGCISRDQIFV